jgi:thiol-disulfide isomerase/thioredoxin
MKKAFQTAAVAVAFSALGLAHSAPAQAQAVSTTTPAALKKAVAARKGQVTLVNFWATWCPGCVAEGPALSKLRKTYAKRGLSLLLVSADGSTGTSAKVRPFLKKHGLPGSLLTSGEPTQFATALDPRISGVVSLPRTLIFNKQGKLVHSFSGEKSYAQWQALVKPLL